MEAAKMLKFLSGLKAPCVILIVAQGDATSGMTDGAWNMLVGLCLRYSLYSSPSLRNRYNADICMH